MILLKNFSTLKPNFQLESRSRGEWLEAFNRPDVIAENYCH
jgi:hypothetical protein